MTDIVKPYFGTDGIRGTANEGLTAQLAMKVGVVAGHMFSNGGNRRHSVVIGKDTRRSGYMIETALTAGFTSAGMDVFPTGPIPTPGLAMLTREMRADIGVMITASHNPFYDNGIKIFGPDGFKLSDEQEHEIDRRLHQDTTSYNAQSRDIGRATRIEEAVTRYVQFAKSSLDRKTNFYGLRIVVDCANGAIYRIAPQVFYELGAEVVPIGINPDGFNINDKCGSTAPEALISKVKEVRADIGIAFDGDADRLIVVDEEGEIVDGDQLVALIAETLLAKRKLRKSTVAVTVMSNLGLDEHLASLGIKTIRTKVGDRHVLESMRTKKLALGGEQSGHIILSDFTTTGDGLIAALQVIAAIKKQGKRTSEVVHRFEPMPQMLKNISYKKGLDPLEDEMVKALIAEGTNKLGEKGLLVRASGTEPLIRVMAQGPNIAVVDEVLNSIATAIEKVA